MVAENIRVILVGVGGATCSGKTTLAKHLRQILPDSVIIHQDDFAPPQELVPFHPVHSVQDWDAPAGAIQWQKMVNFLRQVKQTGIIPPDHRSHDHLNEQKEIKMDDSSRDRWIRLFVDLKAKAKVEKNEKVVWGLVDGFLLYWDKDVIAQLDVRIFLRVPEPVLRQRRHERHGYHTAVSSFLFAHPVILYFPSSAQITPTSDHGVQSDPEGSLWRDPPGYWEQIVYPAYIEAHTDVFEDGDIDSGKPSSKVPDLIVIEPLKMGMTEVVDQCCDELQAIETRILSST